MILHLRQNLRKETKWKIHEQVLNCVQKLFVRTLESESDNFIWFLILHFHTSGKEKKNSDFLSLHTHPSFLAILRLVTSSTMCISGILWDHQRYRRRNTRRRSVPVPPTPSTPPRQMAHSESDWLPLFSQHFKNAHCQKNMKENCWKNHDHDFFKYAVLLVIVLKESFFLTTHQFWLVLVGKGFSFNQPDKELTTLNHLLSDLWKRKKKLFKSVPLFTYIGGIIWRWGF